MYNKPTRCNFGSIVFINSSRYALHVSDALCVHYQEHYKLTAATGVCHELGWRKSCINAQGRLSTVLFHGRIVTDLGHLYRIYSIPTHDKHKWLFLQFIMLLMMDAKGARNTYSIPEVVNKHNTAKVASCWFIIYYILSNRFGIKL